MGEVLGSLRRLHTAGMSVDKRVWAAQYGCGCMKLQHSTETAFLVDLKSARAFLLPPQAGGQDYHTICYPWFVRTAPCCEGTEGRRVKGRGGWSVLKELLCKLMQMLFEGRRQLWFFSRTSQKRQRSGSFHTHL